MYIWRNWALLVSHLHLQRPQLYHRQPRSRQANVAPLTLGPKPCQFRVCQGLALPKTAAIPGCDPREHLSSVRYEFCSWLYADEEGLVSLCSQWVLLRRPTPFPDSLFPFNRNITVTLGAHDMKQEESTWQKLEVKKQFVHPKYNFSPISMTSCY